MDIDLFRDGEHFSTFDSHSFLDNYPDDSTSLDNMHNFSSNELFEWNFDKERELNGDLAVIPVSSDYCDISRVNDTSSCKEDFQKIMNEWQQLINLETTCDEFTIEDPIITPEENEHETLEQKSSLHEILDIPNPKNFDLTTYLNDEPVISVQSTSVKKQKAPVKKIDLKAQRYIIDEDEDDVDVETISEADENSPVLEAGDLNTLLEQFEATEMPDLPLPNNCIESNVKEVSNEKCSSGLAQLYNIKQELIDYDEYDEELSHRIKQEIPDDVEITIKQEYVGALELSTNEPKPQPLKNKRQARCLFDTIRKEIKVEPQVDTSKVKEELSPLEVKGKQNEQVKSIKKENVPHAGQTKQATYCYTKNETPSIKTPPPKHFNPLKPSAITTPSTSRRPPDSTTSCTLDTKIKDSKQILDSLPQELIDRIKESNKRKPISVIPPIPSKRPKNEKNVRSTSNAKLQDAIPKPQPVTTSSIFESSVRLDHDYCGHGQQASKNTYPVSKLAEPYPEHPKRDSGFGSGEEEDRAVVIGKQPTVKNADGKLMVSLLKVNTIHTSETKKKKLNLEEYKKRREGFVQSQNNSQNCSPISSASSSPSPEDENAKRIKHQEKLMKMALEVLNTPPKSDKRSEPLVIVAPPQPVQIPANMEKKTLVSIGVNTDFKIRRNLDPLAPVEQLEEIKPLLKTAKISSNSLITSLIENIPRVIDSCDPEHSSSEPTNKTEHGEDKTIVYLPKNRATIKTSSVSCQTNISLIQQTKASRYRRRRRNSSNSSSCSSSSGSSSKQSSRRRSLHVSRNSSSSRSSFSRSTSTTYSSRSSSRSRSRSRSPSPKYSRKDRERLREVEERRVIYVGHLSPTTSRDDLRKRFQRFGPITNVSLHQRDNGYKDNYGFVTFANKLDAYEALEHGNDDPYQPKYDLSFGGRRIFCKTTYSDLDNMHEEAGYYPSRMIDNSFDTLLREMQEKLRKRKA